MTLSSNVQNLATRVATESKSLRTLINGNQANNNALLTSHKATLVGAINELVGAVGGSGASIDDASVSTMTAYSSSKTVSIVNDAVAAIVEAAPESLDTLNELAAALGDDANFAANITALIAGKANAGDVVTLSGNQTIGGTKTFSAAPQVPDASFTMAKVSGLATELSGKSAVNHTHVASQLPTASDTASGVVELATPTETTTGTDTTRSVTPAGLKSVTDTLAKNVDVGDPNTNFVTTFESGLI